MNEINTVNDHIRITNSIELCDSSPIKNEPQKNSKEAVGSESNMTENDPYAYLNRNEFTSEKFKIEIRNLPKYYGMKV